MKAKRVSKICLSSFVVALSVIELSAVRLSAQQNPQRLRQRHVPRIVTRGESTIIGTVPSREKMQLAIILPLRNQVQLRNLLKELYDPASSKFRHFLSVEEFTEQFGPSELDYASVISWAQRMLRCKLHTTDLEGEAEEVDF